GRCVCRRRPRRGRASRARRPRRENGMDPEGRDVIDPTVLPANLPVPRDDGATAHLAGTRIPSVPLTSTGGTQIDLAAIPGLAVVFAYPRTGVPGQPSLVHDWDMI